MAIVLESTLNKIYTNHVRNYISNGYEIRQSANSNSIVLFNKKDKEYKIVVSFLSSYDYENRCDVDKIIVSKPRVNDYNYYARDNEVCSNYFYKIKDFYGRKEDVYATSVEELNKIRALVKIRKENSLGTKVPARIVKDIDVSKVPLLIQFRIMGRVNSIRGFKKASYNNVTKIQLIKDKESKIRAKITFELNGKTDSIYYI